MKHWEPWVFVIDLGRIKRAIIAGLASFVLACQWPILGFWIDYLVGCVIINYLLNRGSHAAEER